MKGFILILLAAFIWMTQKLPIPMHDPFPFAGHILMGMFLAAFGLCLWFAREPQE